MHSRSWGGAESYLVQLAGWQKAAGLDVVIWCLPESPIHQEAQRRHLPVITDWLPRRLTLWGLPSLARVIRREAFSHVQIHWSGGVMTFAGIKYLRSVQVYYHPHMFIDYPKKDIFHRWAYGQLDRIYVAGDRAKRSYLKNLPVHDRQISQVSYGLELPSRDMTSSVPAFQRWNLPPGNFYAGFMGRIDRQKGLLEFLQAAIPLLERFPKLNLVIVGEPTRNEADSLKYQEEVENFLLAAPHHERIHRWGFQKDFRSLLQCLDVLVMPSYQETYSLMIINAFAVGVPVLSTNDGGTPDLIGEQQERGWLVPPRTVTPLRDVLENLLQHPEQISEKKNGCITYAHSHHDYQEIIKKFDYQ